MDFGKLEPFHQKIFEFWYVGTISSKIFKYWYVGTISSKIFEFRNA
jgi:hypothetical protein